MKKSSKAFFPVNLLLTVIALGYVVLFCTACPPEEEIITITDDFDDNILDPTLWTAMSYGGPWEVAETNHQLEISPPVSGGYALVMLTTPFNAGFLGVQVNFTLIDWKNLDGDIVGGLALAGPDSVWGDEEFPPDTYAVMREDTNYIAYLPPDMEFIVPTSDAVGTFWIVWLGETVYLLYRSDGDWVLLNQGDFPERMNLPTRVGLFMAASPNQQGTIAFDNFTVTGQRITTIAIDIKPGSYPNSINLGSAGVIPVAILSSDTFDATQIDPATVRLAGASIKSVGKRNKPLVHYEDVNGDGLLDLVCQVLTKEFSIESDQSMALFTAMTFDGMQVWGKDSVSIVPSQ